MTAEFISTAFTTPVRTAGHRSLLAVIALLADSTGVALASARVLGSRSLLSVRQIQRLLPELESDGWITYEKRRRDGRQAPNRFVLTAKFFQHDRISEPVEVLKLPKPKRQPIPSREQIIANASDYLYLFEPEELRECLRQCVDIGWVGSPADSLAAACVLKETRGLQWVSRRRVNMTRTEASLDTTTMLWQVFYDNAAAIIEAKNPWAYAIKILTAEVSKIDKASAQDVPVETIFDGENPLTPTAEKLSHIHLEDLLEELEFFNPLVDLLRSEGLPEGLASACLVRCIEIAATSHHSKRHTIARNDETLKILGLSQKSASACMNLVSGTRRGGVEGASLMKIKKGEPLGEMDLAWARTVVSSFV